MRKGAILLAAFALAGSATPALAQQSGVTYDPDSPAGKEYALPLNDARGTGSAGAPATGGAANAGGTSGATGSAAPAAQSDTRFGTGITPAPKTAADRHGTRQGTATATPARSGQDMRVAATEPLSAVTARSGAEQRGVLIPAAAIAAIVAAVGGFGVRRLRRSSAP